MEKGGEWIHAHIRGTRYRRHDRWKNNNAARIETVRLHFYRLYISSDEEQANGVENERRPTAQLARILKAIGQFA